MRNSRHAWPAFWLSLAVPGAGQMLARSSTAVIWFTLAATLIALHSLIAIAVADGIALSFVHIAQVLALAALGLASAIDARRLCLRQARIAPLPATACVGCGGRGRRVQLTLRIVTSLGRDELWRRISDLPRFLTIDPFHERVTLMRRQPAAGVHLVLDHCAFGFRLRRVGRILSWREGKGYTISDLSTRGRHVGFPHVFAFRIETAEDVPQVCEASGCGQIGNAVLLVEIRGKWTSRIIPVWLGRLWLVGVCREHARLLGQAL